MKNVWGKALAILGSAAPLMTLAQDYNYDYEFTTSSSTDSAAGAGLAIGMIIVFGLIGLVGLALLILWIMMLVDCTKRQFEQRQTWLIVLIAGFFLGFYPIAAIVYYFMVKRKNLGTMAPKSPATPAQK